MNLEKYTQLDNGSNHCLDNKVGSQMTYLESVMEAHAHPYEKLELDGTALSKLRSQTITNKADARQETCVLVR